MKKPLIFCSSIFVSLLMTAQVMPVKKAAETNFCKALSKVMANAPDNFIKIQIEQADALPQIIYSPAGEFLETGWNTSLSFPGALKSIIGEYTKTIVESTVLYNPYMAFFGDFKTEAEATKKLNSIKKQLTGCLMGYKLKILRSDPKVTYHFRVHHVFTGKTNGLPAQTIVLQIKKSPDDPLYEVYLMVKGMNSEPGSRRTYKETFMVFGMNVDSLLANPGIDKNIQGQEIRSVKIGTQTWMVDNLNTSTFRNGDPIPEAKSQEDWNKAGEEKRAVWCYYENDPANGKKYGKLYNWYAINDPRGWRQKDTIYPHLMNG